MATCVRSCGSEESKLVWLYMSDIEDGLVCADEDECYRLGYERERTARQAADAEVGRLRELLGNLLVWAKWQRKKRGGAPSMDEPNTGAIEQAPGKWRRGRG